MFGSIAERAPQRPIPPYSDLDLQNKSVVRRVVRCLHFHLHQIGDTLKEIYEFCDITYGEGELSVFLRCWMYSGIDPNCAGLEQLMVL